VCDKSTASIPQFADRLRSEHVLRVRCVEVSKGVFEPQCTTPNEYFVPILGFCGVDQISSKSVYTTNQVYVPPNRAGGVFAITFLCDYIHPDPNGHVNDKALYNGKSMQYAKSTGIPLFYDTTIKRCVPLCQKKPPLIWRITFTDNPTVTYFDSILFKCVELQSNQITIPHDLDIQITDSSYFNYFLIN
jgi:hypothetical protein